MRTFHKVMEAHRQTNAIHYLLPTFQFALNMIRGTEKPGRISGKLFDEEEFLNVQAVDNLSAKVTMKVCKLIQACYTGEYEVGARVASDAPNWPTETFSPFIRTFICLYTGVCNAAITHTNESLRSCKRQRLAIVKKNLRQAKRHVRFSEGRYDAVLHILQAEIYGIRGRTRTAVATFQDAVDCARAEGLTSLMRLASERAAALLSKVGRWKEAKMHLEKAADAYQCWGADAKVEKLLLRLKELDQEHPTFSSSFQFMPVNMRSGFAKAA
ncbi:Histidine kinase [Seminavis robusta]|uniref:Histidine kinase n=1 Tax=Seminavis robusta TaxID=568900 RepID=A0A9N8E8T0_9STRA|nr:Histidine kinase [Seminavis robusta]|eukprot:Sro621_g176690.1 Histidine kinase (270) ;mRNA; r:9490-10299